MSIFGAVKERTYDLIETGECVFTLNEIQYEPEGQFGECLIWKWLIAPAIDPTAYYCLDNGNEKTLHEYTDVDLILGSKQHEWAQILTGRTFENGDAPPDEDELVGRRMVAYLTHYAPKKGKNAGKKREKIVEGSAKTFRGPQPNRVIAPNVTRPAATEAEQERAELIERIGNQIGKAVNLNTPNHLTFVACDLQNAQDDELLNLLQTVKAEVKAALDD